MLDYLNTINFIGKNSYRRATNKNTQNNTHNSDKNITSSTKQNKLFGVSAGLASFFGFGKLAGMLGYNQYKENLINGTKKLSAKEIKDLNTAAQQALEYSGLKEHGVSFVNINEKNYIDEAKKFNTQANIYMEKHSKLYKIQNKITSGLEKLIDKLNTHLEKQGEKVIDKSTLANKKTSFEKQLINKFKTVAEGKNAFFSPIGNIIAVNNKKSPASVFHEMGHALNFNKGRFPMKLRTLGKFAVPVVFGIGLLKSNKPKSESNEKQGLVEKTTSFIKNNAGKLIFASFLPTVAEEALASYKGEKLAKNVLSPKLFKKVHMMNAKALSTYMISSVLLGGITALAIKVRDKVAGDDKI